MPKTRPTPKRRKLIYAYQNGRITKRAVMKELGLVQQYNQFYALYHNCMKN